ncbi:hypothetical protein GIB67_035505, partial [Kingdonia uniflora]
NQVYLDLKAEGAGISLSLVKMVKFFAYKLGRNTHDLDAVEASSSSKLVRLSSQAVVKGYMLYVLGSFLFPSKKGTDMSAKYLNFFENKNSEIIWSWGAATLAHLYYSLVSLTKLCPDVVDLNENDDGKILRDESGVSQRENSVKLIVAGRGKIWFLLGIEKEPVESDLKYAKWFSDDSMRENNARIFQLSNEIGNFKQASAPSENVSIPPTATEIYVKVVEKTRVFQFIAGLNPDFEYVRVHLLDMTHFLTLEEAHAYCLSDQSRRLPMPTISRILSETSAMAIRYAYPATPSVPSQTSHTSSPSLSQLPTAFGCQSLTPDCQTSSVAPGLLPAIDSPLSGIESSPTASMPITIDNDSPMDPIVELDNDNDINIDLDGDDIEIEGINVPLSEAIDDSVGTLAMKPDNRKKCGAIYLLASSHGTVQLANKQKELFTKDEEMVIWLLHPLLIDNFESNNHLQFPFCKVFFFFFEF